MTWPRAWTLALIIVVYFAVTTVWIPSWLISWLGESPDGIAGVVASTVWPIFFGVGAVALRTAQHREWI